MDFAILIVQTIAMLITALLLPGLTISGPFTAFLVVLGISFINSRFWEVALFFQIPDSLSLNALVLVILNGLIFWIIAKLLPGIQVKGILPAILAPIVFTLCTIFVKEFLPLIDFNQVYIYLTQTLKVLKSYVSKQS